MPVRSPAPAQRHAGTRASLTEGCPHPAGAYLDGAALQLRGALLALRESAPDDGQIVRVVVATLAALEGAAHQLAGRSGVQRGR